MKGIIYKIEINENNIYVGSTTQKLCKRQVNHNHDLKKKSHRKLYKSCIENNITNIKCIWVADIEYDSNAELRKIEEDYRKSLNGNLNSYRCYITKEDRKEYINEYHKQNKEKINEKKNEKINCNKCDCLINKSSLKRHQKSIKCLLFSECIFTDEE